MAKYREIAADLRDRRLGSEFLVGDRLPGISELRGQYSNAALNTIRAAVALLAQEKLLRVERGVGTFVVALPDEDELGDPLTELRDASTLLSQALDNLEHALNDLGRAGRQVLLSAADDLEAMDPPLDITAVPAWLRERAAHRG